jgi:two-component system, NtrC family, nitrogen regulation response regulator GlnG
MGLPPTLDAETLDPPSRAAAALPARVPVLTIALHPDLRRSGERAVLTGLGPDGAALSRSEPSFLDGRGRTTGPLADRHVSRAPLRLTSDGQGGLTIDASEVPGRVELDGAPLVGSRHVDDAALDRGVSLALSATVLLVLRRASPGAAVARHGLVGGSDELDVVRRAIDVAARHVDPVLLLGPSGTGKELVANAIHAAGARAAGPFVAVNVATLSSSTAAAELFGHSRGAFTGADAAHAGHFGRADGGTLFLDEIGDAPEAVQPMLLRALESGEVMPVGGRGSRRIDVRVIAATDQDLTASGRFRLPLLHRLSGQVIAMPTLAVRRQDVIPLLVHFLREAKDDVDAAVLPIALARRLLDRSWPGNVRELRNVARTLARGGTSAITELDGTLDEPEPVSREVPPGEITDAQIVAALRANAFRIAATAEALGIAKNTLYKRMERCAGLRRARDLDAREIERAAAVVPSDLESVAARLEVSARGLKLRLRELGLTL